MAKQGRKREVPTASEPPPAHGQPSRRRRRAIWLLFGSAAVISMTGGATYHVVSGMQPHQLAAKTVLTESYVGSETCTGCHRTEGDLWRTSQHKHAMDHATDKSVLGNYSDASFDYYGVRSRFFRKDGKFLIETDGPDGKLAIVAAPTRYDYAAKKELFDNFLQVVRFRGCRWPRACGGAF